MLGEPKDVYWADSTGRRNTSIVEESVLWRKERHVQRLRQAVHRFSPRVGLRSIGARNGSISGD
jgi:hypothetical protein